MYNKPCQCGNTDYFVDNIVVHPVIESNITKQYLETWRIRSILQPMQSPPQ